MLLFLILFVLTVFLYFKFCTAEEYDRVVTYGQMTVGLFSLLFLLIYIIITN